MTHTESDLREALVGACDYRGDVTIHLKTGEQIMGYVFDRREGVPDPYIKLFQANRTETITIRYQDIAEVEFNGEDTAFGRSWEDWIQKWQKRKEP